MKYVIHNLKLPLDRDTRELHAKAADKLSVSGGAVQSFRIVKESVDARRKGGICLVYSVLAEIPDNRSVRENSDVKKLPEELQPELVPGEGKLSDRPVVIGSGPAGLFAGFILARYGYRPLILERGAPIESRVLSVSAYWQSGRLDPESNVQFGEGGAGTFSDGKLTTRIHDRRCDSVLEILKECGAPEEILYKARPHIGTDHLRHVIVALRERIIAMGGEFLFNTRVDSFVIRNGQMAGYRTADGTCCDVQAVVLAPGHSARDTFSALLHAGVKMERKPFSVGVRIEHPQELVDKAQYGKYAGHPRLGPADYQLFQKVAGSRTAYTFCMCPGGVVTASASEPGTIVTNGMSHYARNGENANSAFVVSVEPGDFEGSHPLAGVEFQRHWEIAAFEAGGRDGSAPVQRLYDFMHGNEGQKPGSLHPFSERHFAVKPTYTGSTREVNLESCLPKYVCESLRLAVPVFDRKLSCFGLDDAVLTGVETRTSSPVRISRDDTLQAIGVAGLYPAGEGAGYAGGIISAAVDGMRVAEQLIRTYAVP